MTTSAPFGLTSPGNFATTALLSSSAYWEARNGKRYLQKTMRTSADDVLKTFFANGSAAAVTPLFAAPEADQPLDDPGKPVAVVVLNPNLANIDYIIRNTLKGEVRMLWDRTSQAIERNDTAAMFAVQRKMTSELRRLLDTTLAAVYVYSAPEADGTPRTNWDKPYDFIASLKALYVLLDGNETSREMRQGAVHAEGDIVGADADVVVGTSGYFSFNDERVSLVLAKAIATTFEQRLWKDILPADTTLTPTLRSASGAATRG